MTIIEKIKRLANKLSSKKGSLTKEALDLMTTKERDAYTCIMEKGERHCRSEFGDPIIDKIVDAIATPANKKAEQLGPINDEEAVTDQSKDVIELGEKPKEIIEQEKKDRKEDIEEREKPSITVTGQEQDITVTKEDDEAFDYFVEQLQSGKKVDDAIQLTDSAFYKPESLITRLACDIKYGERKWIKVNRKLPKGFVSVYYYNAERKEAANLYPENSNLSHRVYSLFKRGCRITSIASYNDIPDWYKKAQRYGDGFPVVWVEDAVRAVGLTGRAKTFFENFATSCEGGTTTDENNLGYDMSLYRYKAADVGKIYKAWKLLKDRKKEPEGRTYEVLPEQQDENLPESEEITSDKEIKSNWKVYWNQKNQQYDIQETDELVYKGAQVFESLSDALECKKDLRATIKFLKISVLVQKKNKNTDRTEWALVSKSNPKKILKWFGPTKPSNKSVQKEEKRVQYFKNKGTVDFLSDKIDIGDTISVNESEYSTVIATSKDSKGVFTDNGIDVKYVSFDEITGVTKVKI